MQHLDFGLWYNTNKQFMTAQLIILLDRPRTLLKTGMVEILIFLSF